MNAFYHTTNQRRYYFSLQVLYIVFLWRGKSPPPCEYVEKEPHDACWIFLYFCFYTNTFSVYYLAFLVLVIF